MDAAGIPHESESALTALHPHSNAPIFGMTPTQLGRGIIGGPMCPDREVAETGADYALRIFSGSAAGDLPALKFKLSQPSYDWRELERWDIPFARLPERSTVRFRQPVFWEEHKLLIIAAGLAFLVQGILIARLFAARRRYRNLNASLSLAAEAAEIGLWERDPKNGKFTVTTRWREIFGLPLSGTVTLEMILERLHPDDRTDMETAIREAAREGTGFAMDHRVVLPDGRVRWVASHGRASPGDFTRGSASRGASMDTTDRREAAITANLHRQELAYLSRVASLGVLSGALAHELKQPLAIILANAQAAAHILDDDEPDLAEVRDIIADIVSEDRRAGDVIGRLRTLLRPGEASSTAVDVNLAVQEVIRLTGGDLQDKQISLKTNLAPELPAVLSDSIQLQQVVLNLVVNAADAMGEIPRNQRHLTIRTYLSGTEVFTTVSDTGPGLPGDIAKLFEPFHTTKSDGLGIGLSICRMLISAHGGRLTAESNPHGGATFAIVLPIDRGDPL